MARILNTLASNKMSLGDLDAAEALYEKSLAIDPEPYELGDFAFARTLYGLAKLHHLKKDYEKSDHYFQEAIVKYREVWGAEESYYRDVLRDALVLYKTTGSEKMLQDTLDMYGESIKKAKEEKQHWIDYYSDSKKESPKIKKRELERGLNELEKLKAEHEEVINRFRQDEK